MKEHIQPGMSAYRVAEKYYADDNQCAVVAVAMVARVGYGKAYHTAKRLGRKDRHTTPWPVLKDAIRTLRPETVFGPQCRAFAGRTIGAYEREGPRTGTHLVCMMGGRHVGVMRDGILEDWTSSSVRGKARRFTVSFTIEVQ